MGEAQALSVKRAEVEFHNFASLGEPERVFRVYAEENERRREILIKHREFIGPLTPFLEIGANAGHTSYMLANEFGAKGFALDISADSLRWGVELQKRWNYRRAPVRVAGDAGRLPFRDESLRFVMAYQTLSQFMDIESILVEVKRVLAPGGVFLFAEEPLLRKLSLRLYRTPYYETMKPWERKLFDWGLLGYLVRDVIGAHQEESFGIRQNHTMGLKDWHKLIRKHFVDHRYEIFVPERGWGERVVKRLAVRLDPHRSVWRAARLLGGTLAAVCKKEGSSPATSFRRVEDYVQCPDCRAALRRMRDETLHCTGCLYQSPFEQGVYNLLPSEEKAELYPGDREDIADFSRPSHEKHLIGDWYPLEGVFGNRYRWIGEKAEARLTRVKDGPQRLRIRGFAIEQNVPVHIQVRVNGKNAGGRTQDRPGLFVIEADVPDAPDYHIEIFAGPLWNPPADSRALTVNLSMIRLVPRD
jgi:ubiquinone/menaquinone biosynthesis C-methylase UbiE